MHGQSCHKFLFVTLLQNELGDHAVLYFLGVWLQKALDLDEHHHFRFQPGLPDMQAYKASLSWVKWQQVGHPYRLELFWANCPLYPSKTPMSRHFMLITASRLPITAKLWQENPDEDPCVDEKTRWKFISPWLPQGPPGSPSKAQGPRRAPNWWVHFLGDESTFRVISPISRVMNPLFLGDESTFLGDESTF